MTTKTRAVVIGGGVVGCSVLFHLAQYGWSDCVLVERNSLGSGSSWYAPGIIDCACVSPETRLAHQYSRALYHRLQRVTGISVGMRSTRSLTLLRSDDLDALGPKDAIARLCRFVDKSTLSQVLPEICTSGLVGAIYDEQAVSVNPLHTAEMLAKAAEMAGARVVVGKAVEKTEPLPNGRWHVQTDQGALVADHIIDATGAWSGELGAMADTGQLLDNQVVSKVSAKVAQQAVSSLPMTIRDGHTLIHMREGSTDIWRMQGDRPWEPDATDGFALAASPELNPADLLHDVQTRLPTGRFGQIKSVVQGTRLLTEDGNALIGPAPGLYNAWLASGTQNMVAQAGAIGRGLARWMVEGEPASDVRPFDLSRLSPPYRPEARLSC